MVGGLQRTLTIIRELSLVNEDVPELLTEVVQLSGLFPIVQIHGNTTLAKNPSVYQQALAFERSLADGTVRLTDLRKLLDHASKAGKFALQPVIDPLHLRPAFPALTPVEETAKFEERLRILAEIAKRRRIRLPAQ